MLPEGLGISKRTVVSGMSVAPSLSLYGNCSGIHLLQLPRSPELERACRVHLSRTLLEFLLLSVFSLHLKADVGVRVLTRQVHPAGTCRAGRHPHSRLPACLALSEFQCEESRFVYLLSDHIFCFATDPATMKRPRSSLFCTQASTGYVKDELAPLSDTDT